jgi:hypothetical protein
MMMMISIQQNTTDKLKPPPIKAKAEITFPLSMDSNVVPPLQPERGFAIHFFKILPPFSKFSEILS